MKKALLIALLIIFCGCTIEKTEKVSEEETNLRYLVAAQIYSTITTFYPSISLEKANEDYLNLVKSIQNNESDYFYAKYKEILLNSTLNLHNGYYPTTPELNDTGSLPIKLIYNEGKIYVKQVSMNSPIPLFSEITKVNNQDPLEWFALEYPSLYLQCDTNAEFNYLLKFLETGNLNSKIMLEFMSNGEIITEELTYEHERHWSPLNKTTNKDINYLWEGEDYSVGLIGDIIYMKADSFTTTPALQEIVENLPINYYKIIIDLRDNMGGSSLNAIEFIRPFLSNDFNTPSQIFNDHSIDNMYLSNRMNIKYGSFFKNEHIPETYSVEETNNYFTVVVLINRNCLSACEIAAYYEQQQENTILIGENSGGVLSDSYPVELADGSKIILSFMPIKLGEDYLDSTGVKPDIIVNFDDIYLTEGSDIVLDTAINYLNEDSN